MRDVKAIYPENKKRSREGEFDSIKVGNGRNSVQMDATGLWIGGETIDTAAFAVDVQGNIVIRSQGVGGKKLTIDSKTLAMTWNDGKTDRIEIKV